MAAKAFSKTVLVRSSASCGPVTRDETYREHLGGVEAVEIGEGGDVQIGGLPGQGADFDRRSRPRDRGCGRRCHTPGISARRAAVLSSRDRDGGPATGLDRDARGGLTGRDAKRGGGLTAAAPHSEAHFMPPRPSRSGPGLPGARDRACVGAVVVVVGRRRGRAGRRRGRRSHRYRLRVHRPVAYPDVVVDDLAVAGDHAGGLERFARLAACR